MERVRETGSDAFRALSELASDNQSKRKADRFLRGLADLHQSLSRHAGAQKNELVVDLLGATVRLERAVRSVWSNSNLEKACVGEISNDH
jgi:hypothetical protein